MANTTIEVKMEEQEITNITVTEYSTFTHNGGRNCVITINGEVMPYGEKYTAKTGDTVTVTCQPETLEVNTTKKHGNMDKFIRGNRKLNT